MRTVVLAVVLSGCVQMTTVDGGIDGGAAVMDAGQPDAGVADAGAADAGVADAGAADAGVADAGVADAGVADAGVADAGVDAGPTDGGGPDGGDAGGDAGIPDAGVDAGIDAGPGPACTGGTSCTSGVCVAGDCALCQHDAECGFGRRCGTGVCAPACTTTMDCGANLECCSGRCVDLQRDVAHCGMCGQGCDTDSFCGRGACHLATFGALCQLPAARILLDGIRDDDDAGTAMGEALATDCVPALTHRYASQTDGGVLSANDGQPLLLGELLVMGGGSFRQSGVRWLEDTNTAEVRDTSTGTVAIYSLKDGGVVSNVPFSMLGDTKDRVVVQLVRAPSGALVLNAAGYGGPGTRAAAEYFVSTLFPMRATLTTRWYVVEWTDVDASGGPTAGDTYAVIASGP